jgi:3-hydroxyacyl-[acyl-carrier-protein] dehydratase
MTMQRTISAAQIGEPRPGPNGATVLEFRFSPDDPMFAGHFPGRPLLPGVFQPEMARMGAEAILKCRLRVREVVKAKFLRPVLPAEIVHMSVSFSEEADMIQVRASFSVEQQLAGTTVLVLSRDT